jgi:NitT/TauT family transport system permease protein
VASTRCSRGFRIGFSSTLLGVLVGEMFASQRDLGFLLMNAIGLHDVDTMTAVILLLAIFAAPAIRPCCGSISACTRVV